ncbi:MAG: dihydroorotase [Treponema sp.]|jgi:dihydroorotase|nr:dihydroorotase [Treponema sp.]
MVTVLRHFRIVDRDTDIIGSVIIENGFIREVIPDNADFPDNLLFEKQLERCVDEAFLLIEGWNLLPEDISRHSKSPPRYPMLMPAFVDLHAHFRDPGLTEKETLEAACLASVAGGYGTVVCMANTLPVTDTPEKAAAVKARADALDLIDLYPVLSLSKNMEGRELSGITELPSGQSENAAGSAMPPSVPPPHCVRMISEDGKDIACDELFIAGMQEARRIGVPVSCHCDAGGQEAEAAKREGAPRSVWTRIEENNATLRAIDLGREAGCRLHIAHVSTKEAVEMIRQAKKELKRNEERGRNGGKEAGNSAGQERLSERRFSLTCEATPHHIALTGEDARALGDESHGRVNPPLRTEDDRRAIFAALRDGTIDAVATDHAPHTQADKEKGAPGFTGLETGFAVCCSLLLTGRVLTKAEHSISPSRLSALLSANPAAILGLCDRGRIAPGLRADLTIADSDAVWTVDPARFKSRGKNSPFAGREMRGRVLMTLHGGRVVFEAARDT